MNARLKFATAAAFLLACSPLLASPFKLVKDVNPGAGSGATSYLLNLDTQLFFWAIDGSSSPAGQPWISAGNAASTQQIAEITTSVGHFNGGQLLALNGVAYFTLDNGIDGYQLWRSDGTSPGTFALTSYPQGTLSQILLSRYGNLLVFPAGNISAGYNTSVTDGTVANTHVLSSTIHVNFGYPGVVLNDLLLFIASMGPTTGFAVTDGTPAGTTFFSVPGLTAASRLVAVNDAAYFVGTDAAHGAELWRTDGTAEGTALVKDLVTGANSSSIDKLTRVDDKLFFVARTADAGLELWSSDGTDAGTHRVKDIHPGISDSSPEQLVAINGIVYFLADDGSTGKELWRSDGTDAGTQLALGDFKPGSTGAFDYTYNTVQAVNRKLALVIDSGATSSTTIPYVSDGTLAGTHVVDGTQTVSVNYSGLVPSNGKLYASGSIAPANTGNELIAADAFKTLGNTWCANPEQPIPDNDPAGMISHVHLPSYGGITKLTVSADIGHTWVGDLQIKLRHDQTGTQVVLFDQPADPTPPFPGATCTGDLLDIVFDDAASSNVQTTCTESRPAYPRDQSFVPANPLSAFNGESLKGDWTMTISDNAGDDIGILHEWCMNFTSDQIFGDQFE